MAEAAASQQDVLVLEPSERRKAIVETIHAAEESLVLSLFRCEDFQVLDEIADAVRRKVRVTALLTPTAKNWDKRLQSLELLLGSMGVEVRRYAGAQAKYHAKYLVVDGRMALVASLNFTRKCFDRTCDFMVITRDPAVAHGLTDLFAADSGKPPAPLPADLTPRLLVAPENARDQYYRLLERAASTIRIIDHRVRDWQITKLLQQREASGVKVQILGQGDLAGMISHGKLMLIDGCTAVLGSTSLMRSSLNERREVAVVLEDPDLVARLNRHFEDLANIAPAAVQSAPKGEVADDTAEEDPGDDI